MKNRLILFLCAFFLCSAMGWGQTWDLTKTMTATLDGDGVLKISTSLNKEAIPDYIYSNGINTAPWYDVRSYILSIVIESGVTSIGNFNFDFCGNTTSVTIPNSVISIGGNAFSNCRKLASITIPNSITIIGEYAFNNCWSLTTVTIPNSVTTIGRGAFSNCEALTSIIVDAKNTVYSSDSNGVLYNKDKTILCTYPAGKSGTVTIPASVKTIGSGAFMGCLKLSSVTIPDSVTSIGEYAFYGCLYLFSVTIPNSVTSIGTFAFYWCSSLTSLTIPGSVTSIGGVAFANCVGLKDVTVEWAYPYILYNDPVLGVFNYVNTQNVTLHVPAGTKALYEAAFVWKDFGTIVDDGAPVTVAVTGVSLNKSAATLYVGDSDQLTATVSPSYATNKDVIWSSGDTTVALVSSNGLVTAKSAGTAIITVTSVDGGFTAMCNVEVLKQDVKVEEETEVGEDGTGKIILSLTIPADVLFSGSFRLTLPNGVQLDLADTGLADNLASLLNLTIVQNGDSSWLFTITPSDLRNATEMVYSQIVEIGYTVDETVTGGKHEALISDLLFEFDNGANIDIDELPVTITVNAPTGIPDLLAESFAHVVNSQLYIDSPVAETVQVYSISGVLLQSFQKPAGKASYPINQLKGTILILKGGSGWVKKVIDNEW